MLHQNQHCIIYIFRIPPIINDFLNVAKGRKVIGGIDTLETLSGIRLKLMSLLTFFKTFPEYISKLCVFLVYY